MHGFSLARIGKALLLAAALLPFSTAAAQEEIQPNTQIPLVLVLWRDVHYNGTKRELIVDTPDLKLQSFDDQTSSVGIHPGPDYAAWKRAHGGREPTVTLYTDAGGQGKSVVLRSGIYPDLKVFGMGDKVSSAYFTDAAGSVSGAPSGPAAPFDSIPFVIVLYKNSSGSQPAPRMWLVESTRSLGSDYGSEWNNSVSGVWVVRRAGTTTDRTVEFCENDYFDVCLQISNLQGSPYGGGTQYTVETMYHGVFNPKPQALLSSIRIR